MAWDIKYYCEFTDDLGIDWLVNFEQDGSFTAAELQASGDPLFIEWIGDDDIQETNIMGSRLSLTVEALTDFAYSDLFSSDNLATRVTVYHGVTEFWHGFLLPNTWQEPYDGVPYSVTIEATDGLGLLSDYRFKGLGYTERETLATVIHDILALVQIDTFTEYLNIYESTMDDTTGDSPLLQCGLDHELFKEDTCYDALNEILKSLNAGIRQDNGKFELFRFIEVSGTMHGRTFTDATTKSYVSKSPTQKINRPSDISNLLDMNGGTRMVIPQLKTININHDYKARESWFLNYNFPYAEFDDSDWSIPHWDVSTDTLVQPTSVSLESADDEGVWMLDESSAYEHYIYQELAAKATTEKVLAEFEVAGWASNDSGSIEVELHSTDGVDTKKYGYSLTTGSGSWVDTTLPVYSVITSKKWNTNVSYETVKIPVDGVPYTGTLTIRLYNAISAGSNVNAIYKSVKFYTIDAKGQFPKGIAYVVANANNGQVIDREYIIGDGYGFDNDHLQYSGALNAWDSTDPVPTSLSWHTRGATQNIPLIQLIGQEYGEQYERQKDLIDLPIWEKTAGTFLKINANLQDSYNEYSPGLNRIFVISRAMYDVRRREYQLSLTEIIQ